MYIVILSRLGEGNDPKKKRTSSWFFLHDNAPAHQSDLFKEFLGKEQWDNTGAFFVLS